MMNIKNLKPSKKSFYKQGYYEINEKAKYVGPLPVIYRSSWEKKFCIYLDKHPDVLLWSSEPFKIPYYNILDKKIHHYYPDFYAKIKKDDIIVQYIIEVKPLAQLTKPIKPKNNNRKAWVNYKRCMTTYIINLCKKDALEKFAKGRGYKTLFVTEKTSFI